MKSKFFFLLLISKVLQAQDFATQAVVDTNDINVSGLNSVVIGGYRYGTYKIELQDRLQVSVAGERDLTVNEIVDRSGKINLIHVGEVRVASMTIKQAEEFIANEYVRNRILRNPNVRINILNYAPQEVLMLGQVRRPGPFRFPPEVQAMDLVEAVARNGGLTEIANSRKVVVKKKTGKGNYIAYKVDLQELQKGLQEGRDDEDTRFYIEPGDIVFVPESIF
jgi:protein involved in polysaccharide export with SLBB domain